MLELFAQVFGIISPVLAIAVVMWYSNKATSGNLVREDVKEQLDLLREEVTILKDTNTELLRQRDTEIKRLIEQNAENAKAMFAVVTFIQRYESAGGMADYAKLLGTKSFDDTP